MPRGGTPPRQLSPQLTDWGMTSAAVGAAVPFVFEVNCVAATSSYNVSTDLLHGVRVIDCWGIMTGAGAASDTVKLTDGTNDISDTVDLSSAGDTDRFTVGELDDAYMGVAKGGTLNVTTASGATCRVYIMCVWTD